jgi:hypothetical protein
MSLYSNNNDDNDEEEAITLLDAGVDIYLFDDDTFMQQMETLLQVH